MEQWKTKYVDELNGNLNKFDVSIFFGQTFRVWTVALPVVLDMTMKDIFVCSLCNREMPAKIMSGTVDEIS